MHINITSEREKEGEEEQNVEHTMEWEKLLETQQLKCTGRRRGEGVWEGGPAQAEEWKEMRFRLPYFDFMNN